MSENVESSSKVFMPPPLANFFRTVTDRSSTLLGIVVIVAILSAIASFIETLYLLESSEANGIVHALLVAVLTAVVWYALGYGLSLVANLKAQTVYAVVGAVTILNFLRVITDPGAAVTWLFLVVTAAAVAFLFSEFNSLIPAEGDTRFNRNLMMVVFIGLVQLPWFANLLRASARSEGDLRLYAIIVGLINGAALAAFLVYAFKEQVKKGSSAA